jgi:hypothetical protein
MGREMSSWYFGGGGLLMSNKARDAYFDLARALTRASLADALNVPQFPEDATDISREKVDTYAKELEEELAVAMANADMWTFGDPTTESKGKYSGPVAKFKDYIFLQRLSSRLRTRLAEDLSSRRLPE